MEDFDRAIEDTITAINTGALRARDGTILYQAQGKSFLTNHKYREQMDVIVELLREIRSRFKLAVKMGRIRIVPYKGSETYDIRDPKITYWMDHTRTEIISIFSGLCRDVGIPALKFPRHH